jgi:hypothetical protein
MNVAFLQRHVPSTHAIAHDEPPIHWPSAVVGLFLAIAVVVGVSWLASARQVDGPAIPARSAIAAEAVPAPPPTPIPPPVAEPTPPPAVDQARVANTNGLGVNLRSAAGGRASRLKTLPEGTQLDVLGPEERADGILWRNVREPGGAIGWVAASFLAGGGRP